MLVLRPSELGIRRAGPEKLLMMVPLLARADEVIE
jgi:hypothetical protein